MSADLIDNPAGWYGTIERFLSEPNGSLTRNLSEFASYLNLTSGDSQMRAWNDSIRTVKREFADLVIQHPEARNWGLILEYELPRERGRRPDIVILTGCSAQVIEFKGRQEAQQADVDQLRAYARDLGEYHSTTRGLTVNSVLALDDAPSRPYQFDGTWITGGKTLSTCLSRLADVPPCPPPDVRKWVGGDYAPLPSLVSAARYIFEHKELPQIRRASSAGIPEALKALQGAAAEARENNERHVAFVTGVPGAGKTLVGLQFVYQTRFSDTEDERGAVFLSGNGPLVKVLQHALESTVFVQDVHGFLNRYGGLKKRLPTEHIWVYDEAQRAWDAERAAGLRKDARSEHEDFIQLGMRMPDWAMMVGLIGEGQQIHVGEEGGLEQWNEAIVKSAEEWVIHCPSHVADIFRGRRVRINDALDLTTTLRSHVAGDLHAWVECLLKGRIADARFWAGTISNEAYNLYVTRDIDQAFDYVRTRYATEVDKRYGLLASSKATNLPRYGIDTTYFATRFPPGPWYNDPPTSELSCCNLTQVATEFSCQGLELDFPIVGWDTDLWWNGRGWESRSRHRKARDPHQLRVNSYRVLLTRGRDGMVIYVPPLAELDATYQVLKDAGCRDLELTIPGVE